MQADDISDVIESKYGYHIIQLIEKTAAEAVEKEEALKVIRAQLVGRQANLVVRQYCDRLIASKTPVTIFLELEENLARINGDSDN
jgi:parvulin-like peptidyl-prolyl isomerase